MDKSEIRPQERNSLWRVFLNLRGFAIIGVLVAHSASFSSHHVISNPPIFLAFWGRQLRYVDPLIAACQQIPGYCVPLFLFLAGYSAAVTNQTWASVWQRNRMLFPPYIIWSLMGWAWTVLFALKHGHLEQSWSVQEFLARLVTGDAQWGYFFFILIFQWYILAHWLVPLVKRHPICCMGVAIITQLICMGYNYYVVFNLSPSVIQVALESSFSVILVGRNTPLLYPLFPILGMASASYPETTKRILDWPVSICYALLVFACLFLFIELGIANFKLSQIGYSIKCINRFSKSEWLFSYELWGLVSILFFSTVFRRKIPTSKAYQWLNKNSYTLFILNGPSLLVIDKIIWKLRLSSLGVENILRSYYLLFVIIFLWEIIAPLGIIFFVRKFLPRLNRQLLG